MILTNKFGPDERVYKEAKYLIEKGFDVEIICWDRENEYIAKETEIYEGIKIKRFYPYAKYGTRLKQIKAFHQFIKLCKGYLEGKEYDYLHCHDLDGMLVSLFIKKKNIKTIFDMHEMYELQKANKRSRRLIRLLVKITQNKADFIIYQRYSSKETISKKNKNKLIYLPNYPERSRFNNISKTSSDKLRIAFIGMVRCFDEMKNLMEAVKDIKEIEVSLHGEGVAYTQLKKIEENYSNVKVTGKFTIDHINELYQETDILYSVYPNSIPQYYFAFPVKFFQTIITKTPVIVSKGSILERFLKKYDIGFAVEGGNIDEIKTLIIKINSNKELLQEKKKNLEKIQYEYCWELISANLDKIYETPPSDIKLKIKKEQF